MLADSGHKLEEESNVEYDDIGRGILYYSSYFVWSYLSGGNYATLKTR